MYRMRPVRVETMDRPLGSPQWMWVRKPRRDCRYGYEFLIEWCVRLAERLAVRKRWLVSQQPTVKTFTFHPETLAAVEAVQSQMLAMLNAGKEPEAVLVGGPQWQEILDGLHPYHPHRIGRFHFMSLGRELVFDGVPVVILPTLDGIVVVPEGTLRRGR